MKIKKISCLILIIIISAFFINACSFFEEPDTLEIKIPDTVKIPARGEDAKVIECEAVIYSQFGDKMSGTPEWSLRDSRTGIEVENNKLIISENAEPGTIKVVAEYEGVIETREVDLVYADSRVSDVKILGQEEIYIPLSDETEYSYEAEVRDQYNNIMETEEVSWQLDSSRDGISLKPDGRLLVNSEAAETELELHCYVEGEKNDFIEIKVKYVEDEEPYQEAASNLETIMSDHTQNIVFDDFELPQELEIDEGQRFSLDWKSSNEDIIKIQDGEALVTRPEKDTSVELICTLEMISSSSVFKTGEDPRKIYFEIKVAEKSTSYFNITGEVQVEHNFPFSREYGQEASNTQTSSFRSEEVRSDKVTNDISSREMIIFYDSFLSEKELKQHLERDGYKLLDKISLLNVALIETPEVSSQSKFELMKLDYIQQAENNHLATSQDLKIPDDEYWQQQWHYPQIRLPQAWSVTTGSSRIKIGILDTGVDERHPDLGSQIDIENGYNFVENNDDFRDESGHGTHVAGTIGATTDNGRGVSGILWDCDILPVKVLDKEGSRDDYWNIGKGILYAAGLRSEEDPDIPENPEPVDIINLSLGGSSSNDFLKETVTKAEAEGVVMIASSGNESGDVLYPAAYEETIAVGAVNFNYPDQPEVTDYSCYGSELDLVAPGGTGSKVDSDGDGYPDRILSTAFDEEEYNYSFLAGTSMAAPHVTGVAGLMLAAGISPHDIAGRLKDTAIPLDENEFDETYGYGLINAYWAVNKVEEIKILVGERKDDSIEAVAETSIDNLKGGSFNISNIKSGEYRIFAWIDVRDNNIIESGDYLGSTEKKYFDEEKEYDINSITIEEVK